MVHKEVSQNFYFFVLIYTQTGVAYKRKNVTIQREFLSAVFEVSFLPTPYKETINYTSFSVLP